jgi:uncharacterized caspase-like protein
MMTRLVIPKLLATSLLTLLLQLGATLTASAQNRVALVIGQSNYQNVVQLPNTANDARQMTDLLGQAGFSVMSANDLSQTAMRQAVAEFAAKVAASGPNTIAAVFYAGHGLQVDGENYLVPVDLDPQRESDIPIEAVRLNDVMNTLGALPTSMRIYMLDSCRNNPFPAIAGTTGRGLAMVDTRAGSQGSFISFSTSPGAEAEDGTGADSPYTTALLQVARESVPIEEAFKRVRVQVAHDTDGRQIPWESSSLTSDFRFFGGSGQTPGVTQVSNTPAGGTPAGATVRNAPTRSVAEWKKQLQGKDAKSAYDMVIAENTVEAYEAFIGLFTDPQYGPRIKLLFERRKEMMAWSDTILIYTPASFEAFLARYPGSDLAATARKLLERIRNRTLLANAALAPGGGGLAPTGGGSPTGAGNPGGGSPNSGSGNPQNSSSAPSCTCSQPPVIPINIPVKKPKDTDTPTKKRTTTDSKPHGPTPPTDDDIARAGRPAGGQQGPSGAEVMEGVAIGAGIGAAMGGGMRGGGGGGGYHPQPQPQPPMGGGYTHPNGGTFYGR